MYHFPVPASLGAYINLDPGPGYLGPNLSNLSPHTGNLDEYFLDFGRYLICIRPKSEIFGRITLVRQGPQIKIFV